MLDSMRKLSSGILSKALMLFLVVSFGVWGVGDIVRSSGPGYAAKVGGETISIVQLERQSVELQHRLRTAGLQNVSLSNLRSTAISYLIQRKLALQTMADLGLFVGNDLLGKRIALLPQFQDEQGKFSARLFAESLRIESKPEKLFTEQMKAEISGQFLTSSLDMRDATLPTSVAALEATIRGTTRDVVLLTVPAQQTATAPDAKALADYYEQHKEALYLQPESRNLDYLVLTQNDVNSLLDKAISAEDLKQAATANPGKNNDALREQLRAQQRDTVMHQFSASIEDELAAGKTLAEALHKTGLSLTVQSLNAVTPEQAKTASSEAAKTAIQQGFGMGEGELSGLILTKSGTPLMVAVKKINPAAPKAFEQVKADVQQRLSAQLASDSAKATAQKAKAALAKTPNWQAVANEMHLGSRVVSNLARPSEDAKQDNPALPPALQEAIFERSVGEVAGPLTLANGDQLLAVITQSHTPKIDAATLTQTTKPGKEAVALSRLVEGLAYESFGRTHKVTVNQDILRTGGQAQP